jgi:transposase InsO family protein
MDNIFIERLWRSVKYEKIFLEEFETVPELLSGGLKEYFEFYNFERPHQSLVGKTPAEIYWGREVAKKGSMINELKDKQKYTLTHERNCP